MARENLKRVAINQSLIRPNLLLGGDRGLVILSMCFAVMIPYATFSMLGILVSCTIGVAVWLCLMMVIKHYTKEDSAFKLVFTRHLKYKGFYQALSCVNSLDRTQKSAFDTKEVG